MPMRPTPLTISPHRRPKVLLLGNGMNRVFGGRTAMSSTKTYTGHTLGAAGVTDAGLLVLGLMHGGLKLPAQFSEGQTPDETLPLSGVLREPALIAPGPVMSMNLAFGGSNTALIFEPTS